MAGRASRGGPSSGGQGFRVEVAPGNMGQLLREVKAFDAELMKTLRRELREVGDPVVQAVRHRILAGTSHSNTGLRKGLAAGTKLSIKTGVKSAGVSITTTGAKLPEGKQPMVKAYNKESFRHPVHGHRDRWVAQRGRPFFDQVVDERKQAAAAGVEKALTDALKTVRTAEVRG